MASLASLLIELLRLDYGLPDSAIASRCGVSRVHINYVLHGKRQASRELENALDQLLAECDRGERTLLPNTLAEGKVSRGEPQKGPRIQPQRPVPKPGPHFTPSPKPASGLSAWESKQVSHISPSPVQPPAPPARPRPPAAPRPQPTYTHPSPPAQKAGPAPPTPPVPPRPQASSKGETCIGCHRPGVPTRLYEGKWLCQWDAAARGYRAHAIPTTFTPMSTQQAPTYAQASATEPVPAPVMAEPEPVEDPPPDPSTWVFPRIGFGRDYQDYGRGMFCLACHSRAPTRQVRIANYTQARSVRLCEACCERYGV